MLQRRVQSQRTAPPGGWEAQTIAGRVWVTLLQQHQGKRHSAPLHAD